MGIRVNKPCRPEAQYTPRTVDELRSVICRAGEVGASVRVHGSKTSTNTQVCMTNSWSINMKLLNAVVSLDAFERVVKVQGGCNVKTLLKAVEDKGMTLKNVVFVSHEATVGGLLSTGECPALLGAVECLELLTAQGDMVTCSHALNSSLFQTAICGLGIVGVIVTATFRIQRGGSTHQNCIVRTYKYPREDIIKKAIEMRRYEDHNHYALIWSPECSMNSVMEWVGDENCLMTSTPRPKGTDQALCPPPPGRCSFGKTFLERLLLILVNFFRFSVRITRIVTWLRFFLFWRPRNTLNYYPSCRYVSETIQPYFQSQDTIKISEWFLPASHCDLFLQQIQRLLQTDQTFRQLYRVHSVGPILIYFTPTNAFEAFLAPSTVPVGCDRSHTCVVRIRVTEAGEALLRNIDKMLYQGNFVSWRPSWGHCFDRRAGTLRKAYPHMEEFLAIRDTVDPRGMFHNSWTRSILL
eukprot:PhF_6_TR32935/c0_g2_i1/m.48412/K00103/GULO; L-gulonolactone oxidase